MMLYILHLVNDAPLGLPYLWFDTGNFNMTRRIRKLRPTNRVLHADFFMCPEISLVSFSQQQPSNTYKMRLAVFCKAPMQKHTSAIDQWIKTTPVFPTVLPNCKSKTWAQTLTERAHSCHPHGLGSHVDSPHLYHTDYVGLPLKVQ